MPAGKVWTLPGIHDSKVLFVFPTDRIYFTTIGRYLDANIAVTAGPTILWSFDLDGTPYTDNNADPGEQDFGSEATRNHTLLVTPWSGVTQLIFTISKASEVFTVFNNPGGLDLSNCIAFWLYHQGAGPLDDGQITTINLDGLTACFNLSITNQNISTIQGMSSLTAMSTFTFTECNLSVMPNIPMAQRPNMQSLRLEGNPITSFDFTGYDASLGSFTFGGGGQPTSMPDFTPVTNFTTFVMKDTGIVSGTLPDFHGALGTFKIYDNSLLSSLSWFEFPRLCHAHIYNNALGQSEIDKIIDGLDAQGELFGEDYTVVDNAGIASEAKKSLAVAINEDHSGWIVIDPSANIDLTGYTEDDTPGRITVASNLITIAGLTADDDSYVYTDLGAGNIDGRVWVSFKINISAAAGAGDILCPFLISDTLDDFAAIIAADVQVEYIKIENVSDAPYVRIGHDGTGGSGEGTAYSMQLDRDYWFSICKEDQNGANGRLRCWRSTMEHMGSNVGGGPLWTVNLGSRVDHRYLFAACSVDNGDPTASISCVISDYKVWVE